jgi:hypothetical protein
MKTTPLEDAIEVIGQAISEMMPVEDSTFDEVFKIINTFLQCGMDGYVLVEWPDSQEYMEEEWFEDEAILALGAEEQTGSSAYFIPIKRIVNMIK